MDSGITPGAGTPAPGPRGTAAQGAAADQHLAALRDLVQLVRDHRDAHDCCTPTAPCAGTWAWDQIKRFGPHHAAGLLALAVAELSALGYGLPTSADDYRLTDAARQVLDGGETDG